MSTFHHTFSLIQDDFGNFHMAFSRFVESRSNHFGIYATGHIGHLLRTFVDQQDNHIHFRMVGCDRIGDILQQHRLTGLRLCHDQTTLSLADRREQIYYTYGDIIIYFRRLAGRQHEFFVREKRSQMIERNTVTDFFRRTAVDLVHFDKREIFFTFLRRTDSPLHHVAGLQAEQLDLRLRYVNIIRGSQVVIIGRTQETISVRHHFQHTDTCQYTVKLILFFLHSIVIIVVALVVMIILVVLSVVILARIVLLLSGCRLFFPRFRFRFCRCGREWEKLIEN